MRALVWNGPNDMTVEKIDAPQPGPGEALIRVFSTGICGSDLHGFTGETGRRKPGMVMGHEFAGVIEALGPESGTELSVGDRVAANPMKSCGECLHCRQGNEQICPNRRVIGVNMGTSGAFSDLVVVPIENAVRLPDDVSYAEGAMAEPLAVGLRAASLSGLKPGEPALVLGAGTIGLCILLALRSKGVGPVIVTDQMEHRLELAEKLGARSIHADSDPVQAALDATNGVGVPAALDAAGVSATLLQALRATRPGGTVVFVGLGAPQVSLSAYDLVPQERVLQGSYAYNPRDYREAARLITERAVDTTPLIQRSVDFAEATQAFLDLTQGRDQSVKVMVEIGGRASGSG